MKISYIYIGTGFIIGIITGAILQCMFNDNLKAHIRNELFSECLAIHTANPNQFGSTNGTDDIFIDNCVSKARNWDERR